jgi:cell filamentation protein
MKKSSRYRTVHLTENQFEPGSRGSVLKNLLHIKTRRELDKAEITALAQATDLFVRTYDRKHRFTASDICYFHKVWLGKIFEWAGNYRQVNVSKDNFLFAAARHVPSLMGEFERGLLKKYTPCNFKKREDIVHALAETHIELMLIHPFREGNGRGGRILATLMALQARLPLLDFSKIRGKKKQEYFAAVRAGMDKNYKPMERFFAEIIEKSLSGS